MKILLVESDRYTREWLTTALSSHRYIVDAVSDGLSGLDMATHWDYDLLLLNFVLPKLNGIKMCQQLRAQELHVPILMLTSQGSSEDVIMALDAGADDCVSKTCDLAQLLARVRALFRRAANKSSHPMLKWGGMSLNPAMLQAIYIDQVIALRPKEFNLLELFIYNPQRIFNRSEIIDRLWSVDDIPVEGAVTNLVKDLRQRLKAAGVPIDPIETVFGVGYCLNRLPKQPQAKKTVRKMVASADRENDCDHKKPRELAGLQVCG